jgi:ATP-dependent DNA ligase
MTTNPFPEWLEPMAATLTQERFTGPEWVFERKLDGIRLLAFRQGASVSLYSRTRRRQHLPAVAEAVARIPVGEVVLDGELTWGEGPPRYHVFDVLWLDGRDLTRLSLDRRREVLVGLPLAPPLERVPVLDHPEPWELAREQGWEGVVAKRRDAPYEHRRSKHWLKMKCETRHAFVVGGFTDPQGSRTGLGAFLVGYHQDGDFVFAGKVGTGLDRHLLTELRTRFDATEIQDPPFTVATGLPRVRAHWVRPEVVVEVAFLEWTVHGKLRHSRLLGVRRDVSPTDVTRGGS